MIQVVQMLVVCDTLWFPHFHFQLLGSTVAVQPHFETHTTYTHTGTHTAPCWLLAFSYFLSCYELCSASTQKTHINKGKNLHPLSTCFTCILFTHWRRLLNKRQCNCETRFPYKPATATLVPKQHQAFVTECIKWETCSRVGRWIQMLQSLIKSVAMCNIMLTKMVPQDDPQDLFQLFEWTEDGWGLLEELWP